MTRPDAFAEAAADDIAAASDASIAHHSITNPTQNFSTSAGSSASNISYIDASDADASHSETSSTRNAGVPHAEAPDEEAQVASFEFSAAHAAKPGAFHRLIFIKQRSFIRSLIQPSSVWCQQWNSENQRAEAQAYELFDVFRQRVCLVALLAMVGLCAYMAFSLYVAPQASPILVMIYVAMFLIGAVAFTIAPHLHDIKSLRRFCILCYTLFSLGAGLVLVVTGRDNNYIMGCHSHIILTTLLLPLAIEECVIICAIAFSSLAISNWLALMPTQSHLFFSNLFMLGNTTISVLFIAYFQNVLRRNAFNSTFDKVVAAARFESLSCLDALTGGYNRRHFEQTLELELARSVRFNRPLSVLLFDLDNFKTVNDSNGHAAGDQVLKEVWRATMRCIREVDTAARYGGDEFAVVLPESDEKAALRVARRLQDAMRKTLRDCFGDTSLEAQVTLSIGATTVHPHRAMRASDVIAHADAQLYNAKRKGKNSIVCC